MKKVFLRTAAIASAAAAAFVAGSAQAADGTLTITGKVKSLTCAIGVEGGGATLGGGNLITVPLGTFSTGTANLGGTGSYLGGNNFVVKLTGCTAPDSGKGVTLSFDTSSPSIDGPSGHLKNSLTTGAGNLVAVVRATAGVTLPTGGATGTTPIDFRAGPGNNNMPKGANGATNADFNFLVQFLVTGTVTAGDFQTSIPFAVDMK